MPNTKVDPDMRFKIMMLRSFGLKQAEIGNELGLSQRTVSNHLQSLKETRKGSGDSVERAFMDVLLGSPKGIEVVLAATRELFTRSMRTTPSLAAKGTDSDGGGQP